MEYTQESGLSIPIHERVDSRCVHRDGNGQELTELMDDEGDLFFKDTDDDGTDDKYTDAKIAEVSGVMLIFTYFLIFI